MDGPHILKNHVNIPGGTHPKIFIMTSYSRSLYADSAGYSRAPDSAAAWIDLAVKYSFKLN